MKGIRFQNSDHEKFFYNMINRIRQDDVDGYSLSSIYLLSLCPDTRQHFSDLFDLENLEIIPGGLAKGWQTNTSLRVVRLAFHLWNGFVHDSSDQEDNTVSRKYAVDELFCCSYAPFLYEAIKLRFPEYTRD